MNTKTENVIEFPVIPRPRPRLVSSEPAPPKIITEDVERALREAWQARNRREGHRARPPLGKRANPAEDAERVAERLRKVRALEAAAAEGRTQEQAAKIVKISRSMVKYYAGQHGIKFRGNQAKGKRQ